MLCVFITKKEKSYNYKGKRKLLEVMDMFVAQIVMTLIDVKLNVYSFFVYKSCHNKVV